jgi:hypothetical protein
MEQCDIVGKKLKTNKEDPDLLEWLGEHIKTCETCQDIILNLKKNLHEASKGRTDE